MPHRPIRTTRATLATLTTLTLATLLACGGGGQDSDGATTGTGTGTGTGTAGISGGAEEAPSVAELAACDESDLEVIPFMGPAFDEEGALIAPLPAPHIVATTAGWHTPDNEEALNRHTLPVMMDVFAHEGLLGASFAVSERCGSARTLTLWRDEAARMKFVFGAVHGDAIKNGLKYTRGWETTHYTARGATEPPSWGALRAQLDGVRPG